MKTSPNLLSSEVRTLDEEKRVTVGNTYGEQSLTNERLDDSGTVDVLYERNRALLLFVATRKFRVPEQDAENLIQEVFLSFLQTAGNIENVRAWLVAAIANASRHYWRAQGRTESLPEDFNDQADPTSSDLADEYAKRMTIRQTLGYLQPRCRETLWLHYFEGRSVSEIARELETTNRYAEKLIHNCLKRAQEIYRNIIAVEQELDLTAEPGKVRDKPVS